MSDEYIKSVFSKNLNKLLTDNNKQQIDVAKAINVNATTFNSWCTGQSIPRAGALQSLADYFGVMKSDLLEENPKAKYYLNEETERIAQEIYDNPDLRILLDASRKTKPEDLKFLIDMAKRFKELE